MTDEEIDRMIACNTKLASELGELRGKYDTAHLPGIVEAWKERADTAEAKIEGMRECVKRKRAIFMVKDDIPHMERDDRVREQLRSEILSEFDALAS